MTPEGRIKLAIKELLSQYRPKGLWYWMPVPVGYGSNALDFVLCYRGRFAMIEAKAPGKDLSPRQKLVRDNLREAGGLVFEISDAQGLSELRAWLEQTSQ